MFAQAGVTACRTLSAHVYRLRAGGTVGRWLKSDMVYGQCISSCRLAHVLITVVADALFASSRRARVSRAEKAWLWDAKVGSRVEFMNAPVDG